MLYCELKLTILAPTLLCDPTNDSVNAPGVAADLSHINTPSVVTGYLPKDGGLAKALKDADIVVIPPVSLVSLV